MGACSSLAALPDAIGGLGALTKLDLGGCSSLAALPDAIGELGALTELNLEGCSSLAALPAAIGELGALTTLDLGRLLEPRRAAGRDRRARRADEALLARTARASPRCRTRSASSKR